MIQGDFGVFVASEAIGLSCRDSGLVVESLGGSVGEESTSDEPVEKLALVLTQGTRERLERSETRTHGHGGPACQKAPGVEDRTVVPEVLEVLLEQAGTDRAQVDGEQLAQPSSFFVREVVAALEQQPPRLGEQGGATGGVQAPHLVAAHGVDGLAEQLHDVEAVQNVN